MAEYKERTREQFATRQSHTDRSASPFVDQRPEALRMQRLQQLADESVQLVAVAPAADWERKAPIQRRTGKGAVVTNDTGELHSWDHDDHVKLTLKAGADDEGGADSGWRITLYEDDVEKGTISIFYFKKRKVLKPDNLEVPGKEAKKKGYGNILASYAVKAMKLPVIRDVVKATKAELNLMNPISAHISIKELTVFHNGGDVQDDAAVQTANNVLKQFKGKTKGYETDRFPGFWGRLVYLATQNNVVFETTVGTLNSETTFDEALAKKMLAALTTANISSVTGFGMNVMSPLE